MLSVKKSNVLRSNLGYGQGLSNCHVYLEALITHALNVFGLTALSHCEIPFLIVALLLFSR